KSLSERDGNTAAVVTKRFVAPGSDVSDAPDREPAARGVAAHRAVIETVLEVVVNDLTVPGPGVIANGVASVVEVGSPDQSLTLVNGEAANWQVAGRQHPFNEP